MFGAVGLSTHIYSNRLKSILLLAGFPLLLVLMVGGFAGGMDVFMQYGVPRAMGAGVTIDWNAALQAAAGGIRTYGAYALLGAGVWMVIAYFSHGWLIRRASHSLPVTRAEKPEIYNLLENLCISRGMPMPRLEIIYTPALNAFASGINDKTYTITLTSGLIDRLDRDELETVIAHELTHIMNRDVQLLIIAVVFAGMISFFAEMLFRTLTRAPRGSRGSNGNGRGGGAAMLLIAAVILGIGYLFALVIRFALSRKREFLADAGAVELTKNPSALMRALQKISGHDRVAALPDDVAQMCIENSGGFMRVFATHPPIAARIAAIADMTATPVPALSDSLPPATEPSGSSPAAESPTTASAMTASSARAKNPWRLD